MHDTLEIIYLICAGPILTIVAAVGLLQLRIARQTARMNAKRESYKLAADQCAAFATHVIPSVVRLDKAIQEHNVTFFKNSKVSVEDDGVRVKYPAKEELDQLDLIESELRDVLNNFEAFSLFFITRVADENAGFLTVGRVYCEQVERLLPIIMLSGGGKDYHIHLLQLFIQWHKRLERIKLERENKQIKSRLEKINDKIIRPLGTD